MGACWLMALALLGAGETAGRGDDSEEAAVRALARFGAKVTRDSHKPGKPVVAVDLSSTPVSDRGLEHLRGLANLQMLNLLGTRVTEAGLEHLKGLASERLERGRETRQWLRASRSFDTLGPCTVTNGERPLFENADLIHRPNGGPWCLRRCNTCCSSQGAAP